MKKVFLGISLLILMISCKKENSKPQWNTNLVMPIAYTKLDVFNMLVDSIVQLNSDSSISLVFKNHITGISLDTILAMPDTSTEFTAKLDNITISDIVLSDSMSLGAVSQKDYEQNGPSGIIYSAVNNALNTGLPVDIDPIPQQQYSDISLNADEYFQSLTVSSCKISIDIDNNLILPVSDLILEIRNQSDNSLIVADTFDLIPSGAHLQSQKTIINKTIEGNLVGNIKFASPGVNNVIITPQDTSKVIRADIKVYDIKLTSAVARFPEQNLVDLNEKIVLDIDNDVQLTKIIAKSGQIEMKVYNTLPKPIHFLYKMPYVNKNGQTFLISGDVPAGSPGSSGIYTQIIDLSDYNFRLSGENQDTVNTLNYQLQASIDSTGEFINLSLNDSIYAETSIKNLQPQYAKGWFGNTEVNSTGTAELDLPDEFKNAILNFKGVKFALELQNSIGVSANVYFNSLTALNTSSGNQSNLSIPPEYFPLSINKPNDPGNENILPEISTMNLSNTNSNTDEFFNTIPDKINYNIDFKINDGVTQPPLSQSNDFLYSTSKIDGNLNIEIPLNFLARNLILQDSLNVDLSSTDNPKEAVFHLFAYNAFPLDAIIQLYILDENMQICDSLIPVQNNIIFAGIVDENTHKVLNTNRTQIDFNLNSTQVQKIKKADKLLTKVIFNTKPDNQHVKIYSNYFIKLKLSADFEYNTGAN